MMSMGYGTAEVMKGMIWSNHADDPDADTSDYKVERIVGERGNVQQGNKQYKIKI